MTLSLRSTVKCVMRSRFYQVGGLLSIAAGDNYRNRWFVHLAGKLEPPHVLLSEKNRDQLNTRTFKLAFLAKNIKMYRFVQPSNQSNALLWRPNFNVPMNKNNFSLKIGGDVTGMAQFHTISSIAKRQNVIYGLIHPDSPRVNLLNS